MVSKRNQDREHWLVAAWAGMGHVGLGAGNYLAEKLPGLVRPQFPPDGMIDVDRVEITDGVVSAAPHAMFYSWLDPLQQRDLIMFLDQTAPDGRLYSKGAKLIDYAISHDVTRIVTFAAVPSQRPLGTKPQVFAFATNPQLVQQLQPLDVMIMEHGRMSGLNGSLLPLAAEQGIEGMCLVGEVPGFAKNVPNPRTSQAVLEVFCEMAEVDLDFTELSQQAEIMDHNMRQLMKKLRQASIDVPTEPVEDPSELEYAPDEFADDDQDDGGLDPAAQQRIEALFKLVRRDRSKANDLKRELDRLEVFREYENRFLDLFKG